MFWFCFGDSVAFSIDHFYASRTSGSKFVQLQKSLLQDSWSPCTFSHDPVSRLTLSSDQDLLIDIIFSKFISLYCTRSPSVELKEQIKEVKPSKKWNANDCYLICGSSLPKDFETFFLILKGWTLNIKEGTMNTTFPYGLTAIFLQTCIGYKIENHY